MKPTLPADIQRFLRNDDSLVRVLTDSVSTQNLLNFTAPSDAKKLLVQHKKTKS